MWVQETFHRIDEDQSKQGNIHFLQYSFLY